MRLKKVLAVALAATTALTSGTAYNLLGASASTAEAAYSAGFYGAGDTFAVSDTKFTYTYKVIEPILNGYAGSGSLPEQSGLTTQSIAMAKQKPNILTRVQAVKTMLFLKVL